MFSFCRSGLLVLTLIGSLMPVALAQESREFYDSWFTDSQRDRLPDQSILTEYFGQTSSLNDPASALRVGFIPRFGCAPLITLNFDLATSDKHADGRNPADLTSLSISIDGRPMLFPLLLDNNSDHASVYLNVNLARRITARLRIDAGDLMTVTTQSGEKLLYSLIGSRNGVAAAEQYCRRHDPESPG